MSEKNEGYLDAHPSADLFIEASPLFTVNEVAAYLKLKPTTVRAMARDGELPAIKVGGMWRFQKSRIDQYITQLIKS